MSAVLAPSLEHAQNVNLTKLRELFRGNLASHEFFQIRRADLRQSELRPNLRFQSAAISVSMSSRVL